MPTWRTRRLPAWVAPGWKEAKRTVVFSNPSMTAPWRAQPQRTRTMALHSALRALGFAPRRDVPSCRRMTGLRPALDTLPQGTPPSDRPKASDTSLAPGCTLGIAPLMIDRVLLSTYLDEIRENDPIYRAEGLVHPSQILRLANNPLVQNVLLGPWIHVGSKVRNHAAVHVGQQLTLRSKITSNVVSKGHAIIEFDAIVVADDTRSVAGNHPYCDLAAATGRRGCVSASVNKRASERLFISAACLQPRCKRRRP